MNTAFVRCRKTASFFRPSCCFILGSTIPCQLYHMPRDRSQFSTSFWLGKCYRLKSDCVCNSLSSSESFLAGIIAPSSQQFKGSCVYLGLLSITRAFLWFYSCYTSLECSPFATSFFWDNVFILDQGQRTPRYKTDWREAAWLELGPGVSNKWTSLGGRRESWNERGKINTPSWTQNLKIFNQVLIVEGRLRC